MKEASAKIIVVGESGVGKSCFLMRYNENRFQPIHDVTIGMAYSKKQIQMNDTTITLYLWDTAGQEIFRSITNNYYREATFAIIVYDVTDRRSFDKLKNWMRDVDMLAPVNCIKVVVGNKVDLEEARVVDEQEGQQFAQQNNATFYEVSALTGQNVSYVFEDCAEIVYKERGNVIEATETKNISVAAGSVERNCCK